MSSPFDTVELIPLDNVQVRIVHDPDPMNPRKEYDNFSTMVCWHRRYRLGDEHNFGDPDNFVADLLGDHYERLDNWWGREYAKIPGTSDPHNKDAQEAVKALNKLHTEKQWAVIDRDYFVLPLYLYDHSGITMNTTGFSCPWDSGRVGYIYVSKADARKEFGKYLTKKRVARIYDLLRSEVSTYDEYLTGQVYGYVVETLPERDEDGDLIDDDDEGEQLDSCWGFFGLDYCRQEAMSAGQCENKRIADANTPANDNPHQEGAPA